MVFWTAGLSHGERGIEKLEMLEHSGMDIGSCVAPRTGARDPDNPRSGVVPYDVRYR